MVTAKLFVEGGGKTNLLRTECRRGFSKFLSKAGLKGFMPRIIACGKRQDAFDSFCTAVKNGENAFLLVDSEDLVKNEYHQGLPETWKPFEHLHERDNWDKPECADEESCHLMMPCMEAWLIADGNTLRNFFGNEFNPNPLPAQGASPEAMTKDRIYDALKLSVLQCNKHYDKGDNSFEILGSVDPVIVTSRCSWAKRFVDTLKKKLAV